MKTNTASSSVSRFAVIREMDVDELRLEAQNLTREAEVTGDYEYYLMISQCAHTYRQLTGQSLSVDTREYGTVDWLDFHSKQTGTRTWLNKA